MRGLLPVAAAAALLLAGCLTPAGTQAPGATPPEGSYRFVEVVGNWSVEDPPGAGVCGYPSPPDVDEANRTLRFHNEWPGTDYRVLLLTVTWDRTGCGTAMTTWATSHRWEGLVVEGEGPDGDFRYEMRDDGVLVVDGREVPRGGAETFVRDGTLPDGRAYRHEVVVRDHGVWPIEGVSLAS